jgi:hypothetical protein
MVKHKLKLIALYLPQFHCIPENDEFWGKGFTDWVSVKKAKPLFESHDQPKVPLNDNYYDLSLKQNVEWQCNLASDYGVYGFGVYHYWFNNEKNLLTKPAEIMRDLTNSRTKYFLIWDNCQWKRSWSNIAGNDWAPMEDKYKAECKGVKVLIPYILGKEKDWENHYNYVVSHFKSPNYERIDNKPVFTIFHYSKEIDKMCDYWNKLAKRDGFDGIYFIFKYHRFLKDEDIRYHYQPHFSAWDNQSLFIRGIYKILDKFNIRKSNRMTIYNYDKVWLRLLKYAKTNGNKNLLHGAFVSYDDSPRRGKLNSKIIVGATPEKFKKYFKQLVEICNSQNKPYLFLTAWNEWGEGAYLEPDKKTGFSYLQALKEVVYDT